METGKKTVGQDFRRMLEKLAHEKTVVSDSYHDERGKTHGGNSMKAREPRN